MPSHTPSITLFIFNGAQYKVSENRESLFFQGQFCLLVNINKINVKVKLIHLKDTRTLKKILNLMRVCLINFLCSKQCFIY